MKINQFSISFLVVIAMVALTACETAAPVRKGPLPPISAKSPLTVMSFNIRLGLGRKNPNQDVLRLRRQWGRNLDAVIDAIRSADPDVVGLQEVAGPGQLRKIATALNMSQVFVWHETGSNLPPWSGVGLLSKYPITSHIKAELSGNRNFVIATIDVGTQKIAVANIHRSHLEFSEESMPFLLGELAQVPLPKLLIGDFNIEPNARMRRKSRTKQLQPVLDRYVDSAVEAKTKSAADVIVVGTGQTGGRTDYVFAQKKKFKVLDAGIVARRHRNASKHIAYFAKVIFSGR